MSRWFWIIVGIVIFYNVFIKEDKKASVSYPTINSPSYPHVPSGVYRSPPTFGNYNCTIDCSGHAAGYQWAEDHMIDDEDDCSGNSLSFIEGCKQYVEDNN
jgi:hypothetical protein